MREGGGEDTVCGRGETTLLGAGKRAIATNSDRASLFCVGLVYEHLGTPRGSPLGRVRTWQSEDQLPCAVDVQGGKRGGKTKHRNKRRNFFLHRVRVILISCASPRSWTVAPSLTLAS